MSDVYTYYDGRINGAGSSVIKEALYNASTQNLYIFFVSGLAAGYSNVSSYAWDQLYFADSLGSVYNRVIRGVYKGIPVPARSNLVERPTPTQKTKTFEVVGHGTVTDKVVAVDITAAIKAMGEKFPGLHISSVKQYLDD